MYVCIYVCMYLHIYFFMYICYVGVFIVLNCLFVTPLEWCFLCVCTYTNTYNSHLGVLFIFYSFIFIFYLCV
jgi:hypothetical protein